MVFPKRLIVSVWGFLILPNLFKSNGNGKVQQLPGLSPSLLNGSCSFWQDKCATFLCQINLSQAGLTTSAMTIPLVNFGKEHPYS